MAPAPAPLSADLEHGLRRLKLASMRRVAPELLVTAKTQPGDALVIELPATASRSLDAYRLEDLGGGS